MIDECYDDYELHTAHCLFPVIQLLRKRRPIGIVLQLFRFTQLYEAITMGEQLYYMS